MTAAAPRTKKRSRGRPEGGSEAIIRAILGATLEELGRRGWAALSVEEVARRAGVNKTSVYRRWNTKSDLVRAALVSLHDAQSPVPDTGAFRTDLIAVLKRTVAKLTSPRGGSVIRALMAEPDAALHALARKLRQHQDEDTAAVFERAIAREELSPATDTHFLLEILTAPVVRRIFVTRDKVDDEFLARVVDTVLHGATPAVAPPASSRLAAGGRRRHRP